MKVLVINALLYILTALIFLRKDKRMTIRVLVFCLFSMFALAGIYTICDGTFYSTFGNYSLSKLDIIPYLGNYLLIFIMTLSIGNNNQVAFRSNGFCVDNKIINQIEIFVIIISLVYVVMQFEVASILSSYDFGEIYQAAHDGDLIIQFPAQWMNIAYYRTMQILDILYPVIYLIEFLKLSSGKKVTRSFVIVLLILIPRIMGCAIMANRGGIIFNTASFVFFMIFFWDRLPGRVKLFFKTGSAWFVVLIVFYLAAISISRLGDDEKEAGNSVLRYFGEAFPNLGLRVWEVSDHYLMGMRTFPSVYSLFEPIPNVVSKAEGVGVKHIIFENISGFPIINFKTFYGDLYCEWGPILPFIIIGIYLFIIKSLKMMLSNSVFSLLMSYSVYMAIIWGLFNANKICETDIENTITLFFIGLLLNNVVKKQKMS